VTQERIAVVFDSNIFLQAMISPAGPAGQARQCVERGEVVLFVSDPVLQEARDVGNRDFVRNKYGVTPAQVDAFLNDIQSKAVHVAQVPHIYDNPFDPDDSHYVDLAVATGAMRIVTRDKDLLRLMEEARPEGRAFRKRFPDLEVVDPAMFLKELRRA
jgi:putative PIN family toxin of toxin-antitoxin system